MQKAFAPLRRAGLYAILSYIGLVLLNNSNLNLSNMWIAYTPMFVAVYALTLVIDKQLSSKKST